MESQLAFTELKGIFRDLDSVSLEQASSYLDQLATKSDAVELFGIKIPADVIALWGLPLFLAVQVYFCVLLHTAAGFGPIEIKRAWLGLFETAPAIIMTTLSVVVAPPLVHCLVGVRVLVASYSFLSLTGILFLFLVSLVASLVSFRALQTIRSTSIQSSVDSANEKESV